MNVLNVLDDVIFERFGSFKSTYKKTYDNDTEESKHLLKFAVNLRAINEHNEREASNKKSFKMGVWEHSDLSSQDIVEQMTGYIRKPKARSVFAHEFPSNVPSSVDYTAKGWVTKVMNQGMCGGCYAFSAIGALEGQLAKTTGQLTKLSEQNIVDCSKDKTNGNWGCDGVCNIFLILQTCKAIKFQGDMKTTFAFLANKQHGVNTAVSYRYKGRGNFRCSYNPQNSPITVTDFVEIDTCNETLLMQALAAVGPLAVAIDASQESMQNYKSGVYDDPACTDQINHAVLLTGYGTDSLTGLNYWIVKNSWGPSYGENGYIRIARKSENSCGLCGIASDISYPLIQN